MRLPAERSRHGRVACGCHDDERDERDNRDDGHLSGREYSYGCGWGVR
jgi:hypothetical protein